MSRDNSDGFNEKIHIPRYCVGISIVDGKTGESLHEEGFNTPKIEYIIITLESIIEKLKKIS